MGRPKKSDVEAKLEQLEPTFKTLKYSNEIMYTKLVVALAANPQIYKGQAEDAPKIGRLARQIVDELFHQEE